MKTRARKSTKNGPSLAAFLAAFQIFFFSAFSFVSKKSSKSALWEEIAQSFQTDTRAVVSRKKKLLSFILYSQILSRLVLNTQNKST